MPKKIDGADIKIPPASGKIDFVMLDGLVYQSIKQPDTGDHLYYARKENAKTKKDEAKNKKGRDS